MHAPQELDRNGGRSDELVAHHEDRCAHVLAYLKEIIFLGWKTGCQRIRQVETRGGGSHLRVLVHFRNQLAGKVNNTRYGREIPHVW